MKAETKSVNLFADGASRGNPGPASWGFLIKDNVKTLFQDSGFITHATNNEAEYTAILKGLQKAHEMGYEEVTVFSDSNLVINQLLHKYQVKNRQLLELYKAVSNAAGLFKECNFNNTGREDPDIKKVDALCNDCLDKNSKIFPANRLKKSLDDNNSRYLEFLESSSFENNGRFIMCMKTDALVGVFFSLRVETNKLLPQKGLVFHINCKKFKCENSSTPGWSKEITDDKGKIADAKNFDWSSDQKIHDDNNDWTFAFLGSSLRCFLLGKNKSLPNWLETTQTLPGLESHYVLVQKDPIPKMSPIDLTIFNSYSPVNLHGIPDGWILYKSN